MCSSDVHIHVHIHIIYLSPRQFDYTEYVYVTLYHVHVYSCYSDFTSQPPTQLYLNGHCLWVWWTGMWGARQTCKVGSFLSSRFAHTTCTLWPPRYTGAGIRCAWLLRLLCWLSTNVLQDASNVLLRLTTHAHHCTLQSKKKEPD